jgi:transposase InsO family protein
LPLSKGYGYRRITALLKRDGWQVGKDRVERIWRREGLKVPQRQRPRGRLWFNDGSCVRLWPERTNHVWSYDFVSARTHDGRTVRMLNLIDEHSRECLMIRPERRWTSAKVIEALADVMVWKGVPEHLRSDNGPEFVAQGLRTWIARTGAKTAYIEPGSPWENGYCESFNSKLRDEFTIETRGFAGNCQGPRRTNCSSAGDGRHRHPAGFEWTQKRRCWRTEWSCSLAPRPSVLGGL